MKALYEQRPEMWPAFLGLSSSEVDWHKVEKCAVVWWVHISLFLEIIDIVSSGPKRKRTDCYQHKVPKPASVMVWGRLSAHGMGNLYICEGTINAERYMQVFEQHMLPSKQHLFQGHPCVFMHTMPSHILHVLRLPLIMCGTLWSAKYVSWGPRLLSNWSQARMGKNTSTISVLSS